MRRRVREGYLETIRQRAAWSASSGLSQGAGSVSWRGPKSSWCTPIRAQRHDDHFSVCALAEAMTHPGGDGALRTARRGRATLEFQRDPCGRLTS